jgi:MYXO-CTERM domain-containing protein
MPCPVQFASRTIPAAGVRFQRTRHAKRSCIRAMCVAAATLAMSAVASPASAAGTWTKAPANAAAGGQAFGLWMLTDGRVLSHGSALKNWVVLTPDKKGSYANGTWTSVASSSHSRGGAIEHMLKDGRFFEAGGEYVDGPDCTPALCVGATIYDPVANMWTDVAPGLYDIGDTGSANLSDGRLLVSTRSSAAMQIYDPVANKWTAGSSNSLGNGDENAWAALQNGGILAVGYKNAGAAIYNQATSKWIPTGAVPSGFNTGDTGGISLMFDGRVFVYGFGQSYIYTPGPTGADPGTWALGPKLLNGDEAEDEFSDTLPNGKVWGSLVTMTYGPGVVLQEFDPETNMVTSVTPPPDTGNPYPIGYVNLPNGQVMATCANNDWIYTPDTGPKDAWRPTVSTVVFNSGTTYTLTGTQLSGLINGSDEGDDMTNAQNYPIVSLTDESGDVYYCRSFNFSNMTPSAGSAVETAQFMTPAGLPEGTYNLIVSAVGVQSKPISFTVGVGGGSDGGVVSGSDAGDGADGSMSSDDSGGSTSGGSSSGSSSSGTNSSGSAESGSGEPPTTGDGTDAGGASGSNSSSPKAPSGCGCSTVGQSSQRAGFAALLGLLGTFLARKRRRSSPTGR